MANHKIEIRRRNIEKILQAAEKVFAEKGYGATSMGDIAEQAALPRSNLHYYFSTKDELFRAVLQDLLDVWKQDALCFENFDDPRVVLTSYIRAKMGHSRSRPLGSKIWAEEMLHGAPVLGVNLDESLVPWAKLKEAKIRRWVEEGRILPVHPEAREIQGLPAVPSLRQADAPAHQIIGRCSTNHIMKVRGETGARQRPAAVGPGRVRPGHQGAGQPRRPDRRRLYLQHHR